MAPVWRAATIGRAIRNTTTPFTARRRGLRSPNQYGTTNVVSGITRRARHAAAPKANGKRNAVRTPRTPTYTTRKYGVATKRFHGFGAATEPCDATSL